MAAPHVTGTVALYMENHPAATPSEVTHQIKSTGTFGRVSNIDAASPNLLVFTEPFAPTAATVSVTGMVVDSNGRGIKGVTVALMNANSSQIKRAKTNGFGFYSFDDLDVGGLYVMNVIAKRFQFDQTNVTFTLNEDLTGINFVGTPNGE
jgi:subtilisin family serine protease